ncbi:hypothetical protein [Rhizobium straminoryzae]|uniref:Uncharacterized protein n=1 Tax=Rhizobium straminoryzae TaxID=1387186 RepID=A0A549T1E6_9HYPH|nr:hypothetical protein [Rhizobium straminoryzae]TRL35699.1 hypothetical protein FNA46_19740 [Rhizobium straminoryzae]
MSFLLESTSVLFAAHRGGRDVNRQRPDEITALIVSESLRKGGQISKFAQLNGVKGGPPDVVENHDSSGHHNPNSNYRHYTH